MSITNLNPYIHFDGTADQAIELYKNALGAKTETLMRWGEVPGMNPPPELNGKVMHAHLRIGEGTLLVSDGGSCVQGTAANVQIILDFAEVPEMTKAFDALAAGGKVVMPLADTFWGARFGMLTDAYGVGWKFNCMLKKGDA